MKLKQLHEDFYKDLTGAADELSGGDAESATQLHKQLKLRDDDRKRKELERRKRIEPQLNQVKNATKRLDRIGVQARAKQAEQAKLARQADGILPKLNDAVDELGREAASF